MKILKLINDERKLVSIKGQKACWNGAIDICTMLDSASCDGAGTIDYCTVKDFEGCTSGAYDDCSVDTTACKDGDNDWTI